MPELPEVETVLRSLETKTLDCTIIDVQVLEEKIIKRPAPEQFKQLLQGQKIIGFIRQGKYLIMEIGDSMLLVVHLRMTGRLICSENPPPVNKHTHVIFYLDQGKEIHFQDIRKFGTMHLINREELDCFPPLMVLGCDALDPQLTPELFLEKFKGRKGQVKGLLLNQSFIAGLGNIYANEVLYKAGIQPQRSADSLSIQEKKQLYEAIHSILESAIEYRGTTLQDYVDGDGKQGEFQNKLQVHSRAGKQCLSCGESIIRIKQGGRSSFYCPSCQK